MPGIFASKWLMVFCAFFDLIFVPPIADFDSLWSVLEVQLLNFSKFLSKSPSFGLDASGIPFNDEGSDSLSDCMV